MHLCYNSIYIHTYTYIHTHIPGAHRQQNISLSDRLDLPDSDSDSDSKHTRHMQMIRLFLCCIILCTAFGQELSDGTTDDTSQPISIPPPELNKVTSCYSSRELTKGLCKVDADCADVSERCFTQVCIAKHTIEKTAYKASTVDTIIENWPPLNPKNKMPLMDSCIEIGTKSTAGCYISRYVDWPPGTNTHLRTTDNAGFRGGCSDGFYEMDTSQQLPEGCMEHPDGTRTITCFCSNENDCNMGWMGEYLQRDELVDPIEGTNNSTSTNSTASNDGSILNPAYTYYLLLLSMLLIL